MKKDRLTHQQLLAGLWLTLHVFGCMTLPAGKADEPVLEHHLLTELDSLQQRERRPVAIFLYTDWCNYCKAMQQTTLRHPEVVSQLNARFYFIAFNAEQKEAAYFNGKWYHYQPKGRNVGTHELVFTLGTRNGKVAYPTFVILNSDYELIFKYNAYLSIAEMRLLLQQISQ